MRAAYTAAIIRVLLKHDLHFNWVAGVSAGASNLLNYVSRDADRAQKSFTDFAADPKMGNWVTFLRGKGLFNSEYIYLQTAGKDQALPFDWDTFNANPATIRVGGFNATDGKMVYWGREDIETEEDLLVRTQASSTLPGFMPMVKIGDKTYVDGALGPSGGIAIDAARADGFTRFFVVLSRTRDYWKPQATNHRFLRRHFWRYPALAQAIIDRPDNYNRSKQEILDLVEAGDAYAFIPETMNVSVSSRSVPRLRTAYATGLAQATRELPAMKEFLGF